MSIHYHFIINEHAASGRAKKVAEQILNIAKDTVSYSTHFSQYAGHVYEIIQELSPQLQVFNEHAQEGNNEETIKGNEKETNAENVFPLLVIIGGDGTLHEVMNALYPDHLNIPVAYIPSGSGNDFSRGIGLTRDPLKAWAQIQKNTAPKTVNLLTYHEAVSNRSGVLLNNLGVGLDASIVHATNDSSSKSALNKYHLGNLAYMASILKQLFVQKGFPILTEINGEAHHFKKAFLCTTTNHPYFGGGVKIAPTATPFEKNFDVVIVERIALIRIVWLILFYLTREKQFENKHFNHYQTKSMRLVSTVPQYAQLDGEVWEKQAYDFNFGVTDGLFWF